MRRGWALFVVAIVCFVLTPAFLTLGVHAFLTNPLARPNRVYLVISIVFGAWSLAAFLRNIQDSYETILVWRVISAAVWSFGTSAVLHFCLALIREHTHDPTRGHRYAWLYTPAAVLFIGNVTAIIIPLARALQDNGDGLAGVPQMNRLMNLLFGPVGSTAYYLVYIAIACVALLRWGDRSGARRAWIQSRIVAIPLVVATVLILLYGAIAPVLVDFVLPFLTPLFPLVWAIGMSVAVTRYRLMVFDPSIATPEIMNNVLDIVMLADPTGAIVEVNKRAYEILGFSEGALTGRPIDALIVSSPLPYEATHSTPAHDYCDSRIVTAEDTMIPVRVRMTSVKDPMGETIGRVIAAQDLRLEREFERLSVTDPLTGVDNRLRLDATLKDEATRTRRNGRPFSVALLDVDDFKRVNDEFGHLSGDRVLQTIAETAQRRLRESDRFGRWGGEEFLAIFPDTDGESASVVARKLRLAIEGANCAIGRSVTCSIGVASYTPRAQAHDCDSPTSGDVASLIGRADEALYAAKRNGKNRVEFVG